MTETTTAILLIEDDDGDARLVREMLSEAGNGPFRLAHVPTLNQGLSRLARETFDLVLLDISLPDSQGPDTLRALHETAPDIPVIALTGLDDDAFGIKLLQMGAQDYLIKGDIDSRILSRAVRYAIERQNLWRQLQLECQRSDREAEFSSLEQVGGQAFPTATARLMGEVLLSESLPDVFRELAATYANILKRSLEETMYKVDHGAAKDTRALAERLGFLRATPRDVVALHTTAAGPENGRAGPAPDKLFHMEARLLLLRLMGDLASYYRTYAIGNQTRTTTQPEKG